MKINLNNFLTRSLMVLFFIGLFIGFINPTYASSNNWGQQPPNFPFCTNIPSNVVLTWNSTGQNQIAGQTGQVYGNDKVYYVSNGNSVQCYCPDFNPRTQGIQTNWWNTNASNLSGWISIDNSNGQWGLNGTHFLAQNSSFECSPSNTPSTPVSTSSATTTPSSNNGGGGGGSSTNRAPVCSDGSTIQLVGNPFVVRSKDFKSVVVNFFITEGNGANIYYKEVGQSNWTHSVLRDEVNKYKNSDNFVSYPIRDLAPATAYIFAIQQTEGCGGGKLANSIIIDGPQTRTFMFSYWEWAQ